MTLRTKKMSAEPSDSDGLRICVMRDARAYNRHLLSFQEKFKRPMYDMHIKELAPPRELKDEFKQGTISWEEYIPWFRREVLEKQRDLIMMYAERALNENITFLCTEDNPAHCHRRLLAEECKKYQPGLELAIE